MTTLRNLSRDGPTVIASIHQPSREVFEFPRYTLNNKRLSLQLQKNLFATARDFVCSNHKFCLQQQDVSEISLKREQEEIMVVLFYHHGWIGSSRIGNL
jgi:hypothetical protein